MANPLLHTEVSDLRLNVPWTTTNQLKTLKEWNQYMQLDGFLHLVISTIKTENMSSLSVNSVTPDFKIFINGEIIKNFRKCLSSFICDQD